MTQATNEDSGATPVVQAEHEALAAILDSAKRMGVELDETEAARWVAAMESEGAGGDVVVDVNTGVFGHKVTMLDFSAGELERFRAIGKIVGFDDRPGTVATALALSGSAAQNKIQSYPGDCDYFERVHITAPTRAEACTILADVMREKALATAVGPTYRLWEVKFGNYPFACERDGKPIKAGSPISWTSDDVRAGQFNVVRDGQPVTLTWDGDAAADPGWCKLDWIVADPVRHRLANASNMLDVTWEAPDGAITPLDGFIDPYFQEVYLEAESLPLFSRLVSKLSGDAVDDYVQQLEGEVLKYSNPDAHEPSYGKAARRMYNIFRLTGRYTEAAYLRELFDEPATVLYQVAALIRTIDEADRPGAEFDTETLLSQADALIMSAVSALEGRSEVDMVRQLLRVRDTLAKDQGSAERAADVEDVKTGALAAVNEYFKRRLDEVPGIRDYLAELHARPAPESIPKPGQAAVKPASKPASQPR
jgi:hypothetical protein